jgi:uncharacterized protein YndB with AHSA1/START domain
MNHRGTYTPGPAAGASVEKGGERWTLVLVRDLRHSPVKVWRALTDPEQLREWAPYDADHSLASAGPVTLTTVGAPQPTISQTRVTRAEAPRLLELEWNGSGLQWELEPLGTGTRLKLSHAIDRRFIAWGAAGWHLCFDVLEHWLADDPIGRMVGMEVMQFDGWQRLVGEYGRQFGVEAK